MARFGVQDMEAIMRKFNDNLIRNLRARYFGVLRVMDSGKYRDKFFSLSANLLEDSITMAVVMATIVRNKRRILEAEETGQETTNERS